jgi:uncharacterized repeat protein (TIGR01451 family)
MSKAIGYGLRATASIAILFTTFAASAQSTNCVSLKTEGQIEQEYTDVQGKPAKRLVAPGKVIPGNEIIWTITASNSCEKAAEKVVIENAVPEHMVYVGDSAMGPGTEISYSLNGRDFKRRAELTVNDADGKTRPARAEEIKSIRWVIGTPIPTKSIAFVRYRAKVK